MPVGAKHIVLHYTGYTVDAGGILAVVRALEGEGRFASILGVSPGFIQRGRPRLHVWRGPSVAGERIGPLNLLRTLKVALRVRRWLRRGGERTYHGHSRSGLLVALWLALLGERRVVATVHVFGRQRWFYRLAASVLGQRLFWLGPAMKHYYGVQPATWQGCLPDCVPESAVRSKMATPASQVVVFGCAGGLVPVKQWELVIRALSLIPDGARVRVIHVGEADPAGGGARYPAGLKQLCTDLGVAARFDWRGAAGDMAAFCNEIDCLIVASSREASSVAALEAISAGVPVLASSASGTRDLVERCSGGWLFAADSAEALGRRMGELACGSELAAWRRNDAGLREFTAAASVGAHLTVYRALLEK
jgi:glycosyltransferase involved in cell wall biosynthesis